MANVSVISYFRSKKAAANIVTAEHTFIDCVTKFCRKAEKWRVALIPEGSVIPVSKIFASDAGPSPGSFC